MPLYHGGDYFSQVDPQGASLSSPDHVNFIYLLILTCLFLFSAVLLEEGQIWVTIYSDYLI